MAQIEAGNPNPYPYNESENLKLLHRTITVSPISQQLTADEGFCKWFMGGMAKLAGKDATLLLPLPQKISEMEQWSDQMIETAAFGSDYKYQFFEIISTQIKIIFGHVLNGSFDNYCKWMDSFKPFVKGSQLGAITSPEHFPGIKYVLNSLKIFANLQFFAQVSQTISPPIVPSPPKSLDLEYDQQTNQTKAFILAVKLSLFEEFFESNVQEELELINVISNRDPTYWEWHLLKYRKLQYFRKICFDKPHKDDLKLRENKDEEMFGQQLEALMSAIKLFRSTDKLKFGNAFLTQAVVEGLGENLIREFLRKKKHIRVPSRQVEFHRLFFDKMSCNTSVIAVMTDITRKFMADFPKYYEELLKLGSVFRKLPKPLQNSELKSLQKQLLDMSLKSCSPRCSSVISKCNYTLGILHSDDKNFPLAQRHLLQALVPSYPNPAAKLDLVKVLLRDCDTNSAMLEEHFNSGCPKDKKTCRIFIELNLEFLRGYFYFKMGNMEKALNIWESWLKFVQESGRDERTESWKVHSFSNLEKLGKKWGWPTHDMRAEMNEIKKALEERVTLTRGLLDAVTVASTPSLLSLTGVTPQRNLQT